MGGISFICLAKLHGLFEIFTEGVDVPVADVTMSSQPYRRTFAARMYRRISLPETFSRGLTRVTAIVIFYATLPHQLRDGMD